MASLALSTAIGAICLGALSAAFGQEGAESGSARLEIELDGAGPYTVGSKPQSLAVSAVSDGLPVGQARLWLELVGAGEHVYCTCGQATTNSSGTVDLKWSSSKAGTATLRVTAQSDGHVEAVREFVLRAVEGRSDPPASAGASMWIPSLMLEGRSYEGVIVAEEPRAHGARILLSSTDPSSIRVDRSATILPGDSHAIFSLYPDSTAPEAVTIFASIDGPLVSAESRVYSQQNIPSKLKVVLASNRTMTDSLTTYVFVTDANGAPARVDSETRILLESSHALDAPDSATIGAGDFYARFTTGVFGSGELRAHSDGLESDGAAVEKTTHVPSLQIRIAPRPAGPDSYAKYYAWLEVGGRPYSPPGVLVGQLYTNNTDVAGFRLSGSESQDSKTLYMRNGVVNGTVYTRNAGTASITASFPDLGTAASEIVVGPEAVNGDDPGSEECAAAQDGAPHSINSIRAWVYPETTSGPALLTVAPYHRTGGGACPAGTGDEGYGDCDPDGTPSEGACGELWRPVEVDGRHVSISVSPSGVTYDRTVTLAPHVIRSFASEFKLDARDVGDYVLDATATNVRTASVNFTMRPPHAEEYGLSITPLLVDDTDAAQDVALVSIVNSEGSIVDVQDVFGRPQKVGIMGMKTGDSTVMIANDSAVIRGVPDAKTALAATAPALMRGTAEIPAPGTASGVDLDIPDSVHLHEEFPFAMHAVDSGGIPIHLGESIEIVTSGIEADWKSRRMRANLTGNVTVSILADQGAQQQSVDVFSSTLDLEIRASGAAARVGTPFRIDVLPSADPIVMDVSTSIPWTPVDGSTSIDVTSEVPGRFPVTVTASKRGYAPASETIHVTVEDYAQLGISAAGTDGARLDLPDVGLVLKTRDLQESASSVSLPWQQGYKNLASAQVTFPPTHVGEGGYAYSGATVNGRGYDQNVVHFPVSGDADIEAVYERSVIVGVRGGDVSGAGSHAYGGEVELVASDTDRLAFLLVDRFDRWEDVPPDARIDGPVLRFVAGADSEVTAVYREDYTGMLAVILAAMAVTAGLKYSRGRTPPALSWELGRIAEAVRALLVRPGGGAARRGEDKGGASAE